MISIYKSQSISCFLFFLIFSSLTALSQTKDSSFHMPLKLASSASITNNGISLIPTFTLGKPAAIINFTVGKKLTFEPEFRYALSGKPWSNIFWLRYKLISKQKFNIGIGAHPSIVFSSSKIDVNGVTKEQIKAQRFLAAEIAPNYIINKNLSLGLYYLTSFGASESNIKRVNFITVNTSISNLKLITDYYLRLNPQIYYLKMDSNDGYYYTASATISKSSLPFSIQGTLNNPIKSNIKGGQSFVWNMSLIYAFNKLYTSVK